MWAEIIAGTYEYFKLYRIETIFLINAFFCLMLLPDRFLSHIMAPFLIDRKLVLLSVLSVSIPQIVLIVGLSNLIFRRRNFSAKALKRILIAIASLVVYAVFSLGAALAGGVLLSPLLDWLSAHTLGVLMIPTIAFASAPIMIGVLIVRDLKVIGSLSKIDVAQRTGIATAFNTMKTEFGRGRLVDKIAQIHKADGTRPTGEWPTNGMPGVQGSVACIKLARMDEKWRGLDR